MENYTSLASNKTLSNCPIPKLKNAAEKWSEVAAYVLIAALTLGGNILIIIIVRRNQRMKNATSYLIVNMAISEILALIFVIIINLAFKILLPHNSMPYVNDVFALVFCKSTSFMETFCHNLAMLSLTVISLDRFLAVQFPLRRMITRSRAKKIIAALWFVAFLTMSPKLYGVRHKNRNGNLVCFASWDPFLKNTDMILLIIQVSVFHVTQLCIMAVLYSITVHKLWIRRIPGNVTAANQRLEHQTKVNVLKMCITVVVVFAFCWLPLYTVIVVSYTNVLVCPIPRKVFDALFFLSLTSYAINPLIYFIFSKDYRNGFWDIVKPLLVPCKPSLRPTIVHTMEIADIRSSATSIIYDEKVKVLSFRKLNERRSDQNL